MQASSSVEPRRTGDIVFARPGDASVLMDLDLASDPLASLAPSADRVARHDLRPSESHQGHGRPNMLQTLLEGDPGLFDFGRRLLGKLLPDALPLPGRSDLGVVGGIYIGHVGMLDCSSDGDWVVESAFREDGVHMIPFSEWEARRQYDGCGTWRARIQKDGDDLSEADAEKMLKVAHRYRMQRTHYAIFDRLPGFWLTAPGDDRNIYCSELVWMCARDVGVDLVTLAGVPGVLPIVGPKMLSASRHLRWIERADGRNY